MTLLTKSLYYRKDPLASPTRQVEILSRYNGIPPFSERLAAAGVAPLRPRAIEVFQMNLGKMCNQVCHHCHVDAGPDRREIMTRETMEQCLKVLEKLPAKTIDLTGGAPELNPDFRWLVGKLCAMGKYVIVRCNLTIILSNPRFHDLPEFYRDHGVEVISSLPFYNADRTDRQRGEGVFDQSIRALKMLNAVGYGQPDNGLQLNLVYNPAGAFLPAGQQELEHEFKKVLNDNHGICFNNLYCITNMPISRFLEYLVQKGTFEKYMDRLASSFNVAAARNVMCLNTLSVGWDGALYDCDFNQMLDMKIDSGVRHIADFDAAMVNARDIRIGQHCYGCTAGAGSSCSGVVA